MKNMPQLSIVIPTYNEEETIGRCLESIKRHAKNTETIVVDNFSADKTVEIAGRFTKLVFQKGPERSAQRNFGANKARGKFLLFLDADMQFTKNILTSALTKAMKDKNIIAFPEIAVGENFWEKSVALERNLYQNEKLLAAARLFPRKVFEKAAGFDINLVSGEDWDLTLRAEKLGHKLVFFSQPLIHTERIKLLKEFLRKKHYYSINISRYALKHPTIFARQSSLKNRLQVYLKNWPKLAANPLHSLGYLFLKALIWYDWQHSKK